MMIGKQDQTLQENQYRVSFNLLFDIVEDYLFILDETGRIIRANKAALEKLEYTLEEMINMNVEQLYPLTRCKEVQEIVKGMQEGDISKCLIPLCTKFGKLTPVETRGFKGKWEGNDDQYLLTITRDITEIRKQEKEDQRVKSIHLILESMPFLAWMKDRNGKYVTINRNFADFYSMKSTEIIGKTDFDILPPKIALEHRNIEEEVIRTESKQSLNRLRLKNETKWFEFLILPYFEGVEVIGTIGIANNITEQVQLEMELANQKRFLKTMLDTIPDYIFYKDVNSAFIGCNKKGNLAGLIGITRDITERKSIERQLRKQAEYAELLFSTVPSAVFSVDRYGKIIRWNKIAAEITGYAEAEVMGKECSRVLHGVCRDDCGLCLKVVDSQLINEKCKIVTKGGQIRHVIKSIAVLKDEFGEISEKMECFEDISEMTDLEAELRESKERYAAIVNNAPQIVVIHNKGIVQFVNDAGIETLGYQEGECIGRHMKSFMTENSLTRVNSVLLDRAAGKIGVPYEIELIKKSGEIINVFLKGTEITYEHEKAYLAVMMDITESKQLNAKLRASEEKFRQLAETINEIFLITDLERIVYVSPAYERITGMSCQSLLDNQNSLVELIHPADRESMRASLSPGFLNMNEATSEEFRIIRPDGKIRWLWLQSYSIRDEANSSPLKATSIVDITDRKKIEDKLRERERQTQMELMLAAQVQQDALPPPFAGDMVCVSTIFEPNSAVSGDFFNYMWFEGQNKLCGYIIDVSGHGVATALQTATFKMMLDNILLTGDKIEESDLQNINQKIMHYLYEDSFIALLYFEFDLKAAVLKLISAGITLFLAAKPYECSLVPIFGCYLGMIDNPDIEMVTIPLKAGEIYCMMSDGASDLIELHGLRKQESLIEYKNWLEKLAESPDRNDDFSVICIEILQVINKPFPK